MILTRRRFLQSVAASTLFVAPAIVRSESLMKIFVPGEPAARFRVPDLRGHIVDNPEPPDERFGREMTATEVLERRGEYLKAWEKRWSTSMRTQMANESMRVLNEKIDKDVFNALDAKIDYVDSAHDTLAGHQVTGVWVDEAADIPVSYKIHQQTGDMRATTDPIPGYIPCDGRELSPIEYPKLFQVLGYKYT